MSYTRPSASAADLSWVGGSAYTRPAAGAADLSFLQNPQGHIAAVGPLGAVAIQAASVAAWAAADSPLGAPAILAQCSIDALLAVPSMLGAPALQSAHSAGRVAVASLLGAPAVLGIIPLPAWAAADSPLGAVSALAYHDFTAGLGDAVTLYVMDLVTESGTVRVPISSWQATLQTGSSNYVQCVIPACTNWVGAIDAATEFVISRRAVLPNGTALEYEMVRAPAESPQFDRGPQRHTCTLSGYSDAFAEDDDPPAIYDRALSGVRSISSGSSFRVRCAVDWLLRPGHRAFVEGEPFVVSYINYYAPAGDSYMDVGS